MKVTDRQAIKSWDEYRKQVEKATTIDLKETAVDRAKRVEKLEKNFEAWAKWYFPNYYSSAPAAFHIAASKRWLKNTRWYEVRAWSRELAKSSRAMMEDLYLMLTKKARVKLLISHSWDNAARLTMPYKINLESNHRIINDYDEQQSIGNWEDGNFVSKMGFMIGAVGAGQSPRGFRLEEVRPDIIDFDDIDTDEDCRNPETVKKKWKWIEQAVIPTVSVSGNKRIRFNGNIIAKYSCITEAIKMADHSEVINIRDKNGKSTWARNTEADIDWMLSKVGYVSRQQEYFNNPITEGTIFKEMHYKALSALSKYQFLVCYIDLSYKSGRKNDYKFAVLMGKLGREYHILKTFGVQGTTRELAAGLEDINQWVKKKVPVYWVAEENFMQDIIKKELHDNLKELGSNISITADKQSKIDKFYRIEAALEPLNSNGQLFLNEAERDNPSMKVLEEQFLVFAPGSRGHDDGPDAAEGAKKVIDSKIIESQPIIFGHRAKNNKKW